MNWYDQSVSDLNTNIFDTRLIIQPFDQNSHSRFRAMRVNFEAVVIRVQNCADLWLRKSRPFKLDPDWLRHNAISGQYSHTGETCFHPGENTDLNLHQLIERIGEHGSQCRFEVTSDRTDIPCRNRSLIDFDADGIAIGKIVIEASRDNRQRSLIAADGDAFVHRILCTPEKFDPRPLLATDLRRSLAHYRPAILCASAENAY